MQPPLIEFFTTEWKLRGAGNCQIQPFLPLGDFLEEARAACETLGKIFGEAAEEGEKSANFIQHRP